MSKHDRNTEGDPSSLSGAQKLAEMIRQYWLCQGVAIKIDLVASTTEIDKETRYDIRSNLRQVIPQTKASS